MSTQVKASHILVETEDEAKKIYDEISNGKEFAQAAMEYSNCPSGINGGDLGFFGKGMMVKPFEDVAFSLEIGTVSQPVETQFGWHLILVEDIKKVPEVRASHILVKTEEQAKELYESIKSGKEEFAQAAMEHSSCPSKSRGGDLGFFGRGRMVKPFEDAAFSLKKGELSEPVQTQFGWHLILVTDIDE